jgi:Carboxypeptidase regulatory-like domain
LWRAGVDARFVTDSMRLGDVIGFVFEPNGDPLAGAFVSIPRSSSNDSILALSDKSGRFEVDSLTAGVHPVRIARISARTQTVDAHIHPGRVDTVCVVLPWLNSGISGITVGSDTTR